MSMFQCGGVLCDGLRKNLQMSVRPSVCPSPDGFQMITLERFEEFSTVLISEINISDKPCTDYWADDTISRLLTRDWFDQTHLYVLLTRTCSRHLLTTTRLYWLFNRQARSIHNVVIFFFRNLLIKSIRRPLCHNVV